MSSMVAPFIDSELSYRRERISEDFRRARAPRKARTARADRKRRRTLTARAA